MLEDYAIEELYRVWRGKGERKRKPATQKEGGGTGVDLQKIATAEF